MAMNNLLKLVSMMGLALTVIPSILVFLNLIEFEMHKHLLLLGTALWLLTAPFWMSRTRA